MHDLKHALRMLRSSPVFAATAVLVLTIGIGANVAIFSVVNAVILKPVPYEDPDTLVQLMNGTYGGATSSAGSPARYLLWREQTDVLEHVAAYGTVGLNFTSGDTPERVTARASRRHTFKRSACRSSKVARSRPTRTCPACRERWW